jgi:hypothetical protein
MRHTSTEQAGVLIAPVVCLVQRAPNRIDVNILLIHGKHHDIVSLSAFSRALMRSSNAVSKNGCGTLLESKTVTFSRSVIVAGLCKGVILLASRRCITRLS